MRVMKRFSLYVFFTIFFAAGPVSSYAQAGAVEVVKAAVKKVIRAIDLKVQRLQNKTIWLQNAQKTLENKMAGLKLKQISEWTEKQRGLYASYFDELNNVKRILANHLRVKNILHKNIQLVNEYRASWSLLRSGNEFTEEEMDYLENIYTGILKAAGGTLDNLQLVINAYTTQMSDAMRLTIIVAVEEDINNHLRELRQLNERNQMLRLQRKSERYQLEQMKKIHGL